MEKQDGTIQSILGLTFKHRPLAITDYDLQNMKWHNELKGETRHGEFEKWRNHIKIFHGIISRYDPILNFWIFQHKDHADYMYILNSNPNKINQ